MPESGNLIGRSSPDFGVETAELADASKFRELQVRTLVKQDEEVSIPTGFPDRRRTSNSVTST